MSDTPAKVDDVIPQQLTAEDRVFVSLLEQGFTKPQAYIEAYRDNKTVQKHLINIRKGSAYMDREAPMFYSEEGKLARRRALASKNQLGQLAREKARTKKIRMAFKTFVSRMEDLAVDALDVVEDIMLEGRSEKVRADLAIRMIEHQTGQPTIKQINQTNNEIVITVGEAPDDRRDPQQVAIDKARMAAGLEAENSRGIRKREEPQEALVLDVTDEE